MRLIACIPARLDSKRFPEKVLAFLGGKPLLQWSYEAAVNSALFSKVILAVDDEKVQKRAVEFGAKEVVMTRKEHRNGTSRIIEAVNDFSYDIVVNIQADEPFVNRSLLEDLLQGIYLHPSSDACIWTLKKQISSKEEEESAHCVKVVTDLQGKALYFSRSPIPYNRDNIAMVRYRHVGIYAYTRKALNQIASFRPSELERAEELEQLTPLAEGIPIYVHETEQESLGIDTPADLEKAKRRV